MSVHAGQILTVAGRTVLQRVQSQGLGDVRIPVDTIREVGNPLVVDKVPQEPDFTFTVESLDVSTSLEAIMTGRTVSSTASGSAPGVVDADGTEYKWADCQPINVCSPWKDQVNASAGTVEAGHLIPGFYPTRIRYRYGVTDNATEEMEIAGGSYYYGKFAPIEDTATGNGSTTAYATSQPAIRYRKGGAAGTTFRSVFGVLVDGIFQVEGVDYTVSGGAAGPSGSTATITFETAPANGAKIRYAYFTSTTQTFPQAVHATAVNLPGAVRGRNICVSIASAVGGAYQRISGVQSFELEATSEGQVEREFCNEDPIGRSVTGTDCSGTVTVRSKDADAFFTLMKRVTGVDTDTELIGWLNLNAVRLKVEIQNPKNPGAILKTLYVSDAQFTVPGTPARVNQPTDFAIRYESQSGTYSAFKGSMP